MHRQKTLGQILEAYRKLTDAGGWCEANSRTLECLSTLILSSPGILKKSVGNAQTYIKPLQLDLDIASNSTDIAPLETVSSIIIYYYYTCLLYVWNVMKFLLLQNLQDTSNTVRSKHTTLVVELIKGTRTGQMKISLTVHHGLLNTVPSTYTCTLM